MGKITIDAYKNSDTIRNNIKITYNDVVLPITNATLEYQDEMYEICKDGNKEKGFVMLKQLKKDLKQ